MHVPQYVLTKHLLPAVVNSTGSSSNFTSLMQQAVSAIGSYRTDLQNQLPAPVSSLTQLKGVNHLDTALSAQVFIHSPIPPPPIRGLGPQYAAD